MTTYIQSGVSIGIAALLLCAASLNSISDAQATRPAKDQSALQQHYSAAQRLQQAGNTSEAIREYRAFLAEAQQQLAEDYSVAGDYPHAASLFELALALSPDATALRIESAQNSLSAGDAAQAEALARSALNDSAADAHTTAQAHQILGRALLKQNQDREARAEFEKAVELEPSFANKYDVAVACLDLDDDKCATQAFSELEQTFGDTPALHMQFGLAYGNSDFAPRAIAEFRKAIAEDRRLPGAHYCLAAALLATGDDQKNVPEAEQELKTELGISPHDALTYAALGKLAVAGHRPAEAEKYLKTATSLDPRNPDAFLYLGQLYFDDGRPADAEAALRKAIALTKDPSRNRFQIQKAHFLLGRVLMQQHRAAEAHTEMDLARSFANKDLSHDKGELAGLLNNSAATGVDPAGTPDTAMNHTGQAGAANNPAANAASPTTSAALRAFERRLAPAIADSYNNLGVLAATAGRYPEALADFDRAAEWNPTLDGLDLNRGRAAFMASDFSQAIAPLQRYVNTHKDDAGVRGALAMSQFMAADYQGSVQTLHSVQNQLASIPQMAYVYAESLVKTGQTAEGRQRLEILEAAHPEIADVHRALAEVYAAGRDRQKAEEELHTALLLNSSDPQAHYDLGKLDVESGNSAAAIPELQAAVELAPNDASFHRELALAYSLSSRKQDAQKEADISEKLAGAAPAAQPAVQHDGANH